MAHVEACANTQSTRCQQGGKYLPQVFVEYIKSEVLIA